MVNEIRIYVEGGGDQRSGKAALREGFSKFLSSIKEKVRVRRIRWCIIACGSLENAVEDYQNALHTHPAAFNVLLVDADRPVAATPADHLRKGGFDMNGVPPQQVHLMVQVMEAWIIADLDALRQFYGVELKENCLPRHIDIELVAKSDIYQAMQQATRNTTKGEYHKIRHGPKILALLDISRLRQRAQHCDRFFHVLEDAIAAETRYSL